MQKIKGETKMGSISEKLVNNIISRGWYIKGQTFSYEMLCEIYKGKHWKEYAIGGDCDEHIVYALNDASIVNYLVETFIPGTYVEAQEVITTYRDVFASEIEQD